MKVVVLLVVGKLFGTRRSFACLGASRLQVKLLLRSLVELSLAGMIRYAECL